MDDDVRQELMMIKASLGEQNNRITSMERVQNDRMTSLERLQNNRITSLERSVAGLGVKVGFWGVFGAILGAVGIILLRML